MKQCPECSAQNSKESKFCKNCGANIENVADISKNLSATASSILNQTGNLLIKGAKKIEKTSETRMSDSDTTIDKDVFPGEELDNEEINTVSIGVKEPKDVPFNLEYFKQRKWPGILVVAIIIVFAIVVIFGNQKSNKLIGMWKMYPNEMPGYGISLEISKDTIKAAGDYVKFGGRMTFKYKVVDDSALTLRYDWTFDQWPWSVSHANEIPLKYSVNEDGTTLTLIWVGTDFVFLDNTYNMDYFNQNGVIMDGGSVTFTKVK